MEIHFKGENRLREKRGGSRENNKNRGGSRPEGSVVDMMVELVEYYERTIFMRKNVQRIAYTSKETRRLGERKRRFA